MSDYVTLLGAEDVRRAGSSMASAGEEIRRASAEISEAVMRSGRHVEDFGNSARLIGLAALVQLRVAELAAESANAAAVGERMRWSPDSYQQCDEVRELRSALGLPEIKVPE